jgi:hypothetical protein
MLGTVQLGDGPPTTTPQRAFVHMLEFQGQQCKQVLTLSVERDERNLETIDATRFDLKCNRAERQRPLGAEALRHWVADCNEKQPLAETSPRSVLLNSVHNAASVSVWTTHNLPR